MEANSTFDDESKSAEIQNFLCQWGGGGSDTIYFPGGPV